MAAERSDAQVRGGPGIVKRRGNENDRIEDRGADPGFDGEGAGHLQVRDQAAERMESAGAAAGCAGADHPTWTVGNHQSDARSRCVSVRNMRREGSLHGWNANLNG
eukprot:scaffold358_cov343-Pavlova_lutheri.AAC.7